MVKLRVETRVAQSAYHIKIVNGCGFCDVSLLHVILRVFNIYVTISMQILWCCMRCGLATELPHISWQTLHEFLHGIWPIYCSPCNKWRLASLCTYLVCMIMIVWVFFTGIHYDPSNYHEHVYSHSTDHTSLIIMLLESCPTVLSTSLSNNCHCQTAVDPHTWSSATLKMNKLGRGSNASLQ